jgi:2-methylcitrate dehydratase PrpD
MIMVSASAHHYTATLARFALEAGFEDLPAPAVRAAKRLTLDTLGCAVGGRDVPSSRAVTAVKVALGGTRECTVLAGGERLPAPAACHVNAHYANALDAEETLLHSGHLSACVVPPALAMAELSGEPGKDLVASIAVAFEVAGRIGLSLRHLDVMPDGRIEVGVVSGLSWAAFAATVAAGRALALTPEQMANAFGITVASAPLPIAGRWGRLAAPRPMTKYGLYGVMAEAGVTAALLAREGFTGDVEALDGEHGFWRMMGSRRSEWGVLTDRLGERWLVEETSYKLHPACRWATPTLDLFYSLVGQAGVQVEEIDEVEVLVPHGAVSKFMDSAEVATVVDGQFSIPHLVALAALQGPPSPSWHTPESIADPRLAAFAGKVRVGVNEAAGPVMDRLLREKGHAELIPTVVEVRARGRSWRAESDHASGDPWDPETAATDAALIGKFRDFCRPLLPESKLERAIELIDRLDEQPDVAELVGSLVADA